MNFLLQIPRTSLASKIHETESAVYLYSLFTYSIAYLFLVYSNNAKLQKSSPNIWLYRIRPGGTEKK
jgi:hypothetical protein